MSSPRSWFLVSVSLWLILTVIALSLRPLLVVDETRYLAVAWEMWRDGNYLVPHLNGLPYSHKPPLLFWVINAGWAVFGVSEWWARLVTPLFALGAMPLTVALGRVLWPERSQVAWFAPMLLLGTLPWVTMATLTMFDAIVAFWTLVSLLGVAVAWRGRALAGWTLFAVGLGLGILSKGPVAVAFAAPPALLLPLWGGRDSPIRPNPWAWYGAAVLGLIAGFAIALAWALPAANAGGEAYGSAILWGQTAGRVIKSFAHGRPGWWYVAVLPVVLLPWILWPVFWRGLVNLLRERDAGLRFCLVWLIAPVFIMSMVSGKQIHYLLPLFPGFALLLSRLISDGNLPWKAGGNLLPALPFLVLGLALAALPLIAQTDLAPGLTEHLPGWIAEISPLMGLALAALSAGVGLWRFKGVRNAAAGLAMLPYVAVLLIHLGLMPIAGPFYSVDRASVIIAQAMDNGLPVAFLGKHHGQFTFAGRLTAAVPQLHREDVEPWFERNPNGLLITVHRQAPPENQEPPVYTQPYRSRHLSIWRRRGFLANRALFP